MPRRNDIAKILVIGCVAIPSMRAEKPIEVKPAFCVLGPDGWSLRRFKPLINPRENTVFAVMSFAGSRLLEFKLRRFNAESVTVFDYKFGADGRLNSLSGSVSVFSSWVGEANLFPDADDTIPAYEVKYRLGDHPISRPEDARYYIKALDDVRVYRTAQALPCGAMLKEAETMNATQE